ncbi:MAG: hypothetical protein U5L95_02570 [Candidatus Saccharibacteria bacterium]|nr:hypothetical protein [Candidatus Saccharibacteria bacterium]
MTLEYFKTKHSDLINKGVITFSELNDVHYITIDRFDGVDFLCDAKELASPRGDVNKMGYTLRYSVGCYGKETKTTPDFNNAKDVLLHLINEGKGKTKSFPNIGMFEIEKITKPLIHNGVNLGLYFTWGNHIFCHLIGNVSIYWRNERIM